MFSLIKAGGATYVINKCTSVLQKAGVTKFQIRQQTLSSYRWMRSYTTANTSKLMYKQNSSMFK